MPNQFSRTELLFGKEAMERLRESSVAVFGIGGVGSFTVEALARSGIGRIDIFDNDKVALSNINRQLIATRKTLGQYKVEVMRDRILEINPDCVVTIHPCFYTREVADQYDFSQYSYIVDAIDTVTSKLELVIRANQKNVPIISCMGAGNKLDPTAFEVSDIYKTSVCPLAKVMRKELRSRGIQKLKVVYSKEPAITPIGEKSTTRKQVPGSTSFVPSVAGLIIAGEVIKDLARINKKE